jgi:Baseplate J-like protein
MKQPCGCCAGVEIATPQNEFNRPGLTALSYRAGTYATFFETMIARLSTLALDVPVDDGSGAIAHLRPLDNLTTRELSDPSIALLDAWALVADVLTFYQERIANEGYLETALERRSILELAKLIGYRLRPGISASAFLALTVSTGFEGDIPAGTRAQTVPAAGQSPQFFETSSVLTARDAWNAIKPRLTRPQIITPLPVASQVVNHLGTNADVLDSMFISGVATNIRTGDALLITFGDEDGLQFLRFAEAVDLEAADARTRITLQEDLENTNIPDAIQRFIDDAANAFPGSDLAAQAAELLKDLISIDDGELSVTGNVTSAIPGLRTLAAVAAKRNFVRLQPWFEHMLQILKEASTRGAFGAAALTGPNLENYATSSLARLQSVVLPLTAPPSVQPANPLVLSRSIKAAFTPQSDLVPRLAGALNSIRGKALYAAWGTAEPNPLQLQVFAVRAKAALFASNFAGESVYNSDDGTTIFTPPTIQTAWKNLVPNDTTDLTVIALDAVYDQVKRGSWIVAQPPNLDPVYAKVIAARTLAMDTTHGFAAKVTVLTLDRVWLDATHTSDSNVLRETVIHAQTEEMDLAEEPLDRDIEGASIELDGLYNGLDPGKWVIVAGNRTDVPNVTGLTGAELVMISGVTQGKGKDACYPFVPSQIPFSRLLFISDQNENGDRLVVGLPAEGLADMLVTLPIPTAKQQFCEHIQLAPGLYADAYIPTADERLGSFPDFPDIKGMNPKGPRYAWRIANIASGAETVHTTLEFASPLAYKYDSTTLSIYANVVHSTHGQSTGELLGDGDATKAFQTFDLSHTPLTYLAAATPEGAASTLTVRVNDIEWHENDDLSALSPADRGYTTQTDDSDNVSVIFGNGDRGARVPTGNSNVKATYRYGTGSPGNVDAGQISQLANKPLGLQSVVNPIESSGGADRDTLDQARVNAPISVLALDRLVSVQDYADFARAFAGIGKSNSVKISDGRQQIVHLTIAGAADIPILTSSDLYASLVAALAAFGDPHQPFQVAVRSLKLLVMAASVAILPDYEWTSVAPKIRAAVLDLFSFDRRDLGQTAHLSEAISAIQNVEGVSFVNITTFDAVAEDTSVADLAQLGTALKLKPRIVARLARINPDSSPGDPPTTRILPAELVYLTPDIADTLILTQVGA